MTSPTPPIAAKAATESAPAACPLCGGPAAAFHPISYGPHAQVAGQAVALSGPRWLWECPPCGFRFTHPPVDQETLLEAYQASETDVWYEDADFAHRRGFDTLVPWIMAEAPAPSLLDLGCYVGGFLSLFPDSWAKFGVEPSRKASARARERGVETVAQTYPELRGWEGRVGCVSLLSVLEHMPDPRDLLETISRILLPGGIIAIETGDMDSRFARWMGGQWPYYHLPEHMSFFSGAGLERVMLGLGYAKIGAKENTFHKRPYGLRGRIKEGLRLGAAAYKRLKPSSEPPDDFVTFYDHMVLIFKKVT